MTENFVIECISTAISQKEQQTLKDFFSINPDYINQCYKQTKDHHNELVSRLGLYINPETVFSELIVNLVKGLPLADLSSLYVPTKSLRIFVKRYDKVWLEYPPIMENSTKAVLELLMNDGHTLAFSANTSFISGNTIIECMRNLDVRKYFNEWMFSDTHYCSKPDRQMYFNNVQIHVAMNPNEVWCKQIDGCEFFQVFSNGKSLQDLYEYVSIKK
jgi:hypothetical protein